MSSSDLWVSAHNQNISSAMFHWDGFNWTSFPLGSTVNGVLTGASALGKVWCSASNDCYVVGSANNGKGMIFHWDGASWTEDPNEPFSKALEEVWGFDANNVFVKGWKTTGYKVWRKVGLSWVDMSIPTPWTYGRYYGLWGLNPTSLYVAGEVEDQNGNATQGVVAFYNGISWSTLPVPVGVVSLSSVNGTSVNDLYVTGRMSDGSGVVYHVTNNGSTWTLANKDATIAGYGPVWSKYPGTFLASGYKAPAGPGQLRITTYDANGASTNSVDATAYNPVVFWPDGNSGVVFYASDASQLLGDNLAGFYSGNCN